MDARLLMGVSMLLAGCSALTPPERVYLPNGAQGYSIDCAGDAEWDRCKSRAAKFCGRYTILAKMDGAATIPASYVVFFDAGNAKELVIGCDDG